MSETALVHPLVAGYLKMFDAEAAVLPVGRARELREQVVAHIEDAVGPDASDEEIAAVLHSLGPARALVTEAVAATGKRYWAGGFGWQGWALIGVLLLVVAAVSGYYVKINSMKSVAPLFVEGQSGWWYPPDYTRQVTTEADTATQTTVPIRPGHRQGFFVQVFNFTRMTQTVLGSNLGGGGPNGGTGATVRLSTSDPSRSGSEPHAVKYALPVSIPPGQSRYLRITWTSRGCLPKAEEVGMDSVELRVRVGWITRTEYGPRLVCKFSSHEPQPPGHCRAIQAADKSWRNSSFRGPLRSLAASLRRGSRSTTASIGVTPKLTAQLASYIR